MRPAIPRTSCSCASARGWLGWSGWAGFAALVLVASLSVPGAWAQQDDDFLAAREAFRTGNRSKLDQLAPRLTQHTLYPYVAYWRIRQRLDDVPPAEVREMLAQLADGPLADRLRNDWLKYLGRRAQWEAFQIDQVGIRSEDIEVTCYAMQRGIAHGEDEVLQRSRTYWLRGRPLPEACNPVFEAAIRAGVISTADIWARVRLALEQGQVTLARGLNKHLPEKEALDIKALAQVSSNPRLFLERKNSVGERGDREIVMFALQRLARSAPQEAATRWRALAGAFSAEEREHVWGQLAYRATLHHDPQALSWYGRAGDLTDAQLEWKARAALRASQWNELLATIDSMGDGARAEPEWRYWKARALKIQGKQVAANALLAPLSTEHHFYGLLAGEELGESIGPPAESYRPSESEMQKVAAVPAIRRALALYRLGLRFEGNREWAWAIGGLDDRQLLATAELARRNELWDRAINTAERTRAVHDFGLRYLAPYRDRFRVYTTEHGLDEAWVFGLVRQESRFVAEARSHAGASGLMQLMPGTAKWVAGKLGMTSFRQTLVNDLDVNISLGTYYMKYVLELLDNQPVLASAGYNAGPGRARAWRADEEMEAAIYSETIPFNETRDYVKKVMSNATFYARMFGQRVVSLKERIGSIPPRASAPNNK